MKFPLRTMLASAALLSATPALADIEIQRSSFDQGILVHTNGEEQGTDVTGTLGSGPDAPNIVHFTGDTTAGGTVNEVHLQNGNGQAELTGAEFDGNGTNLLSGDIFLNDGGSDNLGFSWIELAFEGVDAASVVFTLTMLGEPNYVSDPFMLDDSGEAKFAFLAVNGEQILNLHYAFTGGSVEAVRQVRIIEGAGAPPLPEPATWAMMLMGFAASGFALRRRRSGAIAQIA
jgi:hypothetical protein